MNFLFTIKLPKKRKKEEEKHDAPKSRIRNRGRKGKRNVFARSRRKTSSLENVLTTALSKKLNGWGKESKRKSSAPNPGFESGYTGSGTLPNGGPPPTSPSGQKEEVRGKKRRANLKFGREIGGRVTTPGFDKASISLLKEH